jgi:predicted phosphodiesterase
VTLGTEPKEVFELVQTMDAQFILGNHDEFMFKPELIDGYMKVPIACHAIRWCIQQFNAEDILFFKTFKKNIVVNVDKNLSLLFYHGSPDSSYADILPVTQDAKLSKIFNQYNYKIMAGGHTHLQMLRQHKGNWIINPGSVGYPIKEYVAGQQPEIIPAAQYIILDIIDENIEIQFVNINLNKNELILSATNSDNPMKEILVSQYQ